MGGRFRGGIAGQTAASATARRAAKRLDNLLMLAAALNANIGNERRRSFL